MTEFGSFKEELRLSISSGMLPDGSRGIVIKIETLKEGDKSGLAVILPIWHAEAFSEELAKAIYDETKVPHWIKQ